MLKILSKERKMAKKIKSMLNKRGFIVDVKPARKTKSVYLKLDNGACPGIRISNHKNKKTSYCFNMINNYNGARTEFLNGQIKHFYNFNSIGRLISEVERERSNKIIKYGYSNYIKKRDKEIVAYSYNKVA